MPGETDTAELRALQRKAYGRGGQLTEAESERLRALEDGVTAQPTADVADAPDLRQPHGAPEAKAQETQAQDAQETQEPPARGVTRQRAIMTLIAATAAVLAVGVGIGGALFAPRDASIPLTPEQQQRRGELATEAFDPGSVRAVAQNADALVWYATQDGGSVACLILDVDELSQTNCLAVEETERGLSAALSLPSEASGEAAVSDTVYATMLMSTAGEPLVAIQRWGGVDSLTAQFPEEVRDRAESLLTDGFELGLSLVGTFRSAPVWLADRLSDAGATERCLIVDAAGPVVCKGFETAVAEGLGMELVSVDQATGGTKAVTALDLRFTGQQTPYLTVSVEAEEPEAVELEAVDDPYMIQVSPGERVEIPNPGDDG
ncbi:hypothetical protein ACFC14_10380 [Microbacterium sp. NPDC055988]|uniref:hypothetical protein n=1 Tax=Microbacterium sp. NPDC055988 TaxID=3345671 RepID=UPI0035D90601